MLSLLPLDSEGDFRTLLGCSRDLKGGVNGVLYFHVLSRCQVEGSACLYPVDVWRHDCLRGKVLLMPRTEKGTPRGLLPLQGFSDDISGWDLLVHTPRCPWDQRLYTRSIWYELRSPSVRLLISESLCGISNSDPGYMVNQKSSRQASLIHPTVLNLPCLPQSRSTHSKVYPSH